MMVHHHGNFKMPVFPGHALSTLHWSPYCQTLFAALMSAEMASDTIGGGSTKICPQLLTGQPALTKHARQNDTAQQFTKILTEVPVGVEKQVIEKVRFLLSHLVKDCLVTKALLEIIYVQNNITFTTVLAMTSFVCKLARAAVLSSNDCRCEVLTQHQFEATKVKSSDLAIAHVQFT